MINLTENGLNRLAFQFKQSEKLKNLISSQLDDHQEVYNSLDDLLNDRLLDTSIGQQLDGLGEILGFPRPYLPVNVLGVFGFFGDETSRTFGSLTDPEVGGRFVDYKATFQIADDDTYRKLLKSKAIINSTSMTVEETVRTLSFMFDGARVRYTLTVNLAPQYTIEKILDGSEIALLGLLPVLIGLENVTYVAIDTFTPFGFDGDPDALGFTDINNTDVGGNFAIIL